MKKQKRFKHKAAIIAVTALAALSLAGTGISKPEKGDNPVSAMIRFLEVGKPVSHGALTIIPVYAEKIFDRTQYITLEEAVRKGWIEITELDGGRVPQVRISNLSRQAIYLMGGEILTGCKQDRILAQDILLAPGVKNLIAPVFCVEQGRWTARTTGFTTKSNLGTPGLRALAQSKAPSAQSEIWDKIAKDQEKLAVESRTSAYQDAYEKEENRAVISQVEIKMKQDLHLKSDTIGVIIGLGGEIASVDLFANPSLFQKQWPKILRSSALSSIEHGRNIGVTAKEAAVFLKSLEDKPYRSQPALSLGSELSLSESNLSLYALILKNGLIHLSAFPQEEERIKVKDVQIQTLFRQTNSGA